MGRTAHHAALLLSISLSLSFVCSLVVSLLHRPIARCSLRWSCLVSLVCVALVWLVRHLFDWGFGGGGGLGRHWRASLVSEISLSRLED